MNERLSRRSALLAIGGATAVAAVPVAAIASGQSVDRSAWDRVFAAYQRAKAKDDAFEPTFNAVYKQVKAEEAAVPHITLRPSPYTGHREPITTEDRRFMIHARKWVEDIASGKMRIDPIESLQEHYQLCKDVVEAEDKRTAAIAAIHARHDYDAISDKWEALSEATCAAESLVVTTPAPDHEALLWKLERLFGPDVRKNDDYCDSWCPQWMNAVMTDARRLLSQGRA